MSLKVRAQVESPAAGVYTLPPYDFQIQVHVCVTVCVCKYAS